MSNHPVEDAIEATMLTLILLALVTSTIVLLVAYPIPVIIILAVPTTLFTCFYGWFRK